MISKINEFLDRYFSIEVIRTSPKEAILFAKKYFGSKKIKAVEIGVLRGKNSLAILNNLNIEKIYLVDPYEKYEEYRADSNYFNVFAAEKRAKKVLNKFKEKVIWIKEYSNKAVKKIKEKVDFIYVDGNHEYEYVLKDLELYWPIIVNGGVLSGHDIQYEGVSRAVLEFARKNNLEIHFGDRRDWWIIKSKRNN